ncbi:MAG: N-acetyltransferase [Chloroflexi bacterium]|nr:N-acetyltransferase [Chloroflexota bacterium]
MLLKTIRLRDRTPVTLRLMRPDDAPLLLDMHHRLSESSIYFRYLRYRIPTLEQLAKLTQMTPDVGLGIVATIETPVETIVGHAYYIVETDDQTTAEPAVLVEDRFQGRGLGRALLDILSAVAWEQGIEVFNALVHPSNEQLLGIVRRSGLPFQSKYAYGMREIQVRLNPDFRP